MSYPYAPMNSQPEYNPNDQIPQTINQPIIPNQPTIQNQPIIPNQPTIQNQPIIPNQPMIHNQQFIPNQPMIQNQPIILNQPMIQNQQMGYNQPMLSNQPIISDQPILSNQPIVSNQILPSENPIPVSSSPPNLKSNPQMITCPHCGHVGLTRTVNNFNIPNFICCWLTSPILWVLFQVLREKDISCVDAVHYCERCNAAIGTYSAC